MKISDYLDLPGDVSEDMQRRVYDAVLAVSGYVSREVPSVEFADFLVRLISIINLMEEHAENKLLNMQSYLIATALMVEHFQEFREIITTMMNCPTQSIEE